VINPVRLHGFHAGTDCPRGMSGGPVFDANGGVFGVVSRGFDVTDQDEPVSFCASIAPLFTMPLPRRDGSSISIADSDDLQLLSVIGPAVTIMDTERGQTVLWSVDPPDH
jgi:hypothetical protein